MGTRSTVKFYDNYIEENKVVYYPLVSIYQQYDGYPDGVGLELAEFLNKFKILNGINGQSMEDKYANGISCLAAQYIKEFKVRIGGLYITSESSMEEYNYNVKMVDNKLIIQFDEHYNEETKEDESWEGSPQEFIDKFETN